jgi:hypothetical protein
MCERRTPGMQSLSASEISAQPKRDRAARPNRTAAEAHAGICTGLSGDRKPSVVVVAAGDPG